LALNLTIGCFPVVTRCHRVIISTGGYIGEGFDDPRLDTLFLVMPISWHGTLAQYAGRLHRTHHTKKEVVIYDNVDASIPMLARMAQKRMKGYKRLGYDIT
jgi:superfamily II DNA or RNA helicase